jgi:hypothetical protein
MNRIISTALAASLTLAALAGCQSAKGGDADKGGDDPALNAPTTSVTSTASPTKPSDEWNDTLWGKMKDSAPYIAWVRANVPDFVEGLSNSDPEADGIVEKTGFIGCEDYRKGWTTKQIIDKDFDGAPGATTAAQFTTLFKAAQVYLCPDQKGKP